MSIDKVKDIVYKSEDEYLTKKIISGIKQGSINKTFVEQIDILLNGITELIETEYPVPRTLIHRLGPNQNLRFFMTLYCINKLSNEINKKFQDNAKTADDFER